MKILQINSCYGCLSTGKIVKDLENIIIKNGGECKCVFGRSGKVSENSYKFNSKTDIYIHAAVSRITDKSGMYSRNATKKMIDFIKEYSPDIIHLHNIHGYYLNIEMLFNFLKKYNRPVVWTLHDCWAFTGHCAYFDYAGCSKWKTGCFDCQNKCQYPSAILADNSKRNYFTKKSLFTGLQNAVVVTPSQWLCDIVKQSFLKNYPIEVIPNGIDTNVFKPTYGSIKERYKLNDKKIVLGVAGTWDYRKGLDDFISLSGLLPDNYRIVLIGLSDEQIKKLPDRIIGIKRTSNAAELAEWYTAATVFVNPTYEDNYPTVNLEAQCCGTYVISYDTGGCGETIADGCGVVVRRGNIDELSKAINQASLNGFSKDCKQLFDKNKCFDGYISLYKKMLDTER